MTELDLSNINIDLTYQDGLRLSELYGKLGELQYNLEHLDFTIMQERLFITVMIIVLGVLVGILVVMALAFLLQDSEHEDRYFYLGIALYIVAVAAIIYFAWDYTAVCAEMKLERNIQSTQMQIDAILMKYGWTGI
ncbi:MAG: hypothetical protein ACI381_06160 [Candidatus Methanomethylophilaceae archaeon]